MSLVVFHDYLFSECFGAGFCSCAVVALFWGDYGDCVVV